MFLIRIIQDKRKNQDEDQKTSQFFKISCLYSRNERSFNHILKP